LCSFPFESFASGNLISSVVSVEKIEETAELFFDILLKALETSVERICGLYLNILSYPRVFSFRSLFFK
jgi:hypothetical protein